MTGVKTCALPICIVFLYKNKFLSSVEFGFELEAKHKIEIDFIENSNMYKNSISNEEKQKYFSWLEKYLFYFDTPISLDFEKYGNEKHQQEMKKIMIVPIGYKAPKIFQKKILINAEYVYRIGDFYPTPPQI